MADEKLLSGLALRISGFFPQTEPPTNFGQGVNLEDFPSHESNSLYKLSSSSDETETADEEVEMEEPTNSSDQDSSLTVSVLEKKQSTAKSIAEAAYKDVEDSDDGAVHSQKKRRTRSPTHLAVPVAADQNMNVEEHTCFRDYDFPAKDDNVETPPTQNVAVAADDENEVVEIVEESEDYDAGPHRKRLRQALSAERAGFRESGRFQFTVEDDNDQNSDERADFLVSLQYCFPAEEDSYQIYEELSSTLVSFENEKIKKIEARARAGHLLIGVAQLYRDFVRLLKISDNSRPRFMNRFLKTIDTFRDNCKSMVKDIKQGQKFDRRYIDILIEDPVERSELVADLHKEDPERSDALRHLEKKVRDVKRMKTFVSDYFEKCLQEDPQTSTQSRYP